MRDVHTLPVPKRYVEDLDVFNLEVVRLYPGVRRHGSVGAWHWAVGDSVDGEVVAEAWLHARRPGWWVRVKTPNTK